MMKNKSTLIAAAAMLAVTAASGALAAGAEPAAAPHPRDLAPMPGGGSWHREGELLVGAQGTYHWSDEAAAWVLPDLPDPLAGPAPGDAPADTQNPQLSE